MLPPLLDLAGDLDTPFAARIGVGAVFEEQQGIRRILLADDEALSAGIEPGLSVNAALSLLPELILEERDPAREAGAVGQLAAWAERFTSFVVAESDDALLLEVAGSLRLFGGVGRIRCEVWQEVQTCIPSLKGFCSRPTQRAQPQP